MSDKIKVLRIFFAISIFVVIFLGFYESFLQYKIWSGNEVSKFLLPPHKPINYFIFYAFTRFFASYVASFIAAILFYLAARFLNRKYEERFFYPEELYLGALSLFLTGHPGWLFYAIFLIIIYLLIHLYSLFIIPARSEARQRRRDSIRVSLYYLWLPTAIFVIIIQRWLEALSLWSLLKF